MRAKKNRALAVDPTVTLVPKEISEGQKRYNDWHWGIDASRVIDWNDKDYPRMLIECGRLIRLHVRCPEEAGSPRHPLRRRDAMIELSQSASRNSHIAFDPEHADERLYLLVDPKASRTIARRFWDENEARPIPLGRLAMIAGGRHGKKNDYPNVVVKPIGILTNVVYYTHKKGDENLHDPRSYYIHAMGELSHYYPVLACDERGRLWLAGGNYTSPTPGITD